jgi:DNA-binding NarL/FixJ family response regulator
VNPHAAGTGAAPIRTVIVDDEADMRLLIGTTLALDSGIEIAGEAVDGPGGLACWRDVRPDVVVLDMRMPGMSGLDVARQILAEDPAQRVVMCSAYMDQDDRDEARSIGVAAVVDKMDMDGLARVINEPHRAA